MDRATIVKTIHTGNLYCRLLKNRAAENSSSFFLLPYSDVDYGQFAPQINQKCQIARVAVIVGIVILFDLNGIDFLTPGIFAYVVFFETQIDKFFAGKTDAQFVDVFLFGVGGVSHVTAVEADAVFGF